MSEQLMLALVEALKEVRQTLNLANQTIQYQQNQMRFQAEQFQQYLGQISQDVPSQSHETDSTGSTDPLFDDDDVVVPLDISFIQQEAEDVLRGTDEPGYSYTTAGFEDDS